MFAAGGAEGGGRRPHRRPHKDALREFHEFSKKMKMDTGLTIKTIAGGDIVELDDLLSDADGSESESSDGFSDFEREFAVDPEAALQPDQGDESYIDPETGDFVEPGRPPSRPSEPTTPLAAPRTPLAGLDLSKDVRLEDILDGEGLAAAEDAKLDEPGETDGPRDAPPPPEPEPDEPEAQKADDDKMKGGSATLNVRRNIREVMDENQLDASTLAAQRQESERLARVQEQQRIIREVRRQIALGRQDKAQARVLSLLQGRTGSSVLKKPMPIDPTGLAGQKLNIPGTVLMKLPSGETKRVPKPSHHDLAKMHRTKCNLTPSVSIAPVGSPMRHDIAKISPAYKKEVVEIVDSSSTSSSSESGPSSDSDDCIMLSDSELPPSPEPDEDPQNSGLHVNDTYNVPDEQGRVVINIGHPENEEDIFLAPQIGRIIKPHQIGGVRFLFDNIIESVERFSNSTGFGCILAHSMGLGKTLQIVCFCDIFLRHTSSKTVLCIMPINTLQNWVAEFNMWLPLDASVSPLSSHGEVRSRNFPIYVLNDSHKTLQARAKVIKEWNELGGVLMIGYELYRLLSLKKNKKPRNRKKKSDSQIKQNENKDKSDNSRDIDEKQNEINKLNLADNKKVEGVDYNVPLNPLDEMKPRENNLDFNGDKSKDGDFKDFLVDKKEEEEDTDEEKKLLDEIYYALVKPGPDLVICDEGHRIKNSHSNISYALKQMRTKRRIVLTGYPLQNNLLEYWCMVDFVRPNYLGTKTEFSNMFERPIQNGQCIDSTPQDIRLMRYRAHVLHSLLVGFVQRRSHAVLQSTLPQKEEYVLLVRMTELQRKLYDVFMNEVVRKRTVPNPLKAFAVCCKIWNHPDVLYSFLKKRNETAAVVDFDLEIEDNPTLPATNQPVANKKGRKSKATPRKREKAPPKSAKNGKPAATIPPNTSNNTNPTETSELPKIENSNVELNVNPNPTYTPIENNEIKPPFEQPVSNQTNNYPSYQDFQQYPHGNYYGQNEPYDASYGTGYYQNQSYNNDYNNYNTQNSQAPPENSILPPQQNVPRYPENSDFNSQNYWNNDNNYYNNSNSNYYPEQPAPQPPQQQPQPQPEYQTNQDPYSAIFDPFTQQDQSYQFNENRSYDSNIPNGEHPRQTFGSILESTNTFTPSSSTETTRPFDQTIATSGTDSNNFNNSIYPTFQGTQDISLESDSKSSLHDEISTLCWPVGTEDNIKQEDMESSNTSQVDLKQEAKADSDTEIKIADLDTMKVIVNDKPRIKMEDVKSENKDNLDVVKTETDIKQNIKTDVPLTDDILKKEDKGKSKAKPKTERKPREKKPKEPKEPKEKKSKVTKEIKDKAKNKEKDKPEKDITDVDSDIEGEKIDSAIDKMKYEKSEEVPYDWATELLKSYIPGIIENSGKMEIFFCVLEESVRLGDRILLFSQSLFTLSLIEDFLQKNIIPGTDQCWMKNKSYYRLDGSTSALEREKLINEFNSNPNIHLFLVSTRAGSLGINLVGANRVVVFDASWNPCHDTQAVCRVYRYGQKKPCFVYRLVMDWCLEKKIYDRQINKQGMADRVVDECNPDAVLSMKEVTNLCWDNDEKEINFKELDKDCKDKYIDVIMRKIMEEHTKTLSKEPFQHESLLVDRKEKKLSSAEKRLAQRGYELEKKAASNPKPSLMYRTIRTADGTLIQRPVASVRPMQHGGSSSGGTRWIPADVWQRQGMTAQEMTLPLDVVIPTNSAEKSNIVLKAGQKVMVLKSPKGIYMQLESGKIIAIKTSFKVGQKNAEQKEIPKKILPSRPPNVNLPGSLKNNSAITVISKSARGNMSKMIARPSVLPKKVGTPIRPMMSGPRIIDQKIRPIHSNLQVRPYSLIRGRAPLYRGSRPIPIQNHLNIKIQGSSIRGPGMNVDYKDYSREIERMPSEQDFDVNMESINHSDFNQPNEPGSSMYKVENDNFENSPSKSLDQQADSSDNYEEDGVSKPLEPTLPEDVASEDSSQERTYVDLSDKSDTKITTKPINKKSPSSKPATSANLFKDCNIQIKNTLLPSSPLDLGFVNNVTIKRTSAPGSALPSSILTNSSPMKERSLGPVHILPEEACLSEGIMSDYKLPPSQNSIPDDNYADNSVTIKEKKIYKPNLVDRKTKTSSLKNYRHQKFIQKPIPIQSVDFALGKVSPASTSSSPTPPPASIYNSLNQSSSKSSQDKYESSLSQLEKTTSLINRSPKKGGMSDFQQSLSDITRTYSPNSENSSIEPPPYKPGPKSRKKKNPSQTELRGTDSSEAVNAILEKIPNKNIASGVDISLSQSISPDNSMPSSQLGNFSQNSYNNAPESAANPGGFAEPGYQQTAPGNSESLPQQPYNSYPGYPPAGGSYPPYPPASYYQPYPPAHYPGYPQYPTAPAYPPGPYPPSPYPGYPPYPNPNTHQW